ncbi:hypothetical protein [Robbsia andropogonis]|uniref:hypothetical protein n=1 Tax=Robbsia andropogonis TaxID=28092 RepID=UPI000617118A|nr:hypothetical protein [Robbsia andropogonis]
MRPYAAIPSNLSAVFSHRDITLRQRVICGSTTLLSIAMLAAPVAAHADNVFYNVNNQLTASIGGHHLNYKESTDQ